MNRLPFLGFYNLKHLFYVHSNITLLSCLAVIDKNCLEDYVILLGRGYSNSFIPLQCPVISLPKTIRKLDVIPTHGIFKPYWLYKKLRALDNLIHNLQCESFHCYLPHTNNYLMQAIITHPKCIEYNIIDEGLLNYTHPKLFVKQTNTLYSKQSFLKRGLKYFSHFNRSIVINPIRSTLHSIYLFAQSDFVNTDFNITKINYPSLDINLRLMSNEHIFVFDNSIHDQVIEESIYYQLLHRIFKDLKQQKMYIKFHPAQKDSEPIITLLSSLKVNYEVLPIDLPLELVMAKSTSMKLYGLWSSLLFYGANSGHEVLSYIKTASAMSTKAKAWTESHMPAVFYKHIKVM